VQGKSELSASQESSSNLPTFPNLQHATAGQVLIGVEHAPINMNDLYLIQGVYPVRPSLPSVVGNEGVGRVLAIGRGVDHLKVGDRVLVPLYGFSWRERLVAPAAGLSALPEADPRQLAMLGINPPTAALLLNESIDLRLGDWVAQNAANSGVGRSLIAIAKARGLKTIKLSTHWRTGIRGNTSVTRRAARSVILRPPQLGQNPRPLHENGTSRSNAQVSHRTRAKPWASTPHVRKSRNSRSTNSGRCVPPAARAASARNVSKCSRTTPWRMPRSVVRGWYVAVAGAMSRQYCEKRPAGMPRM